MTNAGKPNSTFSVLKDIVDGKIPTVLSDGVEKAAKVSVSSRIGLNEFYIDHNGTEELVSGKRNDGGFIRVVNNDANFVNKFEVDMVINKIVRKEADPERNLPEKGIVSGVIFDFKKMALPVSFTLTDPKGIDVIEDLGVSSSQPAFCKLWGTEVSETIVRRTEEESAFGEANVREVKMNRKDWILTGMSSVPYDWDTEGTITADELKQALADHELKLAEDRARREEYRNTNSNARPSTTTAKDEFNF